MPFPSLWDVAQDLKVRKERALERLLGLFDEREDIAKRAASLLPPPLTPFRGGPPSPIETGILRPLGGFLGEKLAPVGETLEALGGFSIVPETPQVDPETGELYTPGFRAGQVLKQEGLGAGMQAFLEAQRQRPATEQIASELLGLTQVPFIGGPTAIRAGARGVGLAARGARAVARPVGRALMQQVAVRVPVPAADREILRRLATTPIDDVDQAVLLSEEMDGIMARFEAVPTVEGAAGIADEIRAFEAAGMKEFLAESPLAWLTKILPVGRKTFGETLSPKQVMAIIRGGPIARAKVSGKGLSAKELARARRQAEAISQADALAEVKRRYPTAVTPAGRVRWEYALDDVVTEYGPRYADGNVERFLGDIEDVKALRVMASTKGVKAATRRAKKLLKPSPQAEAERVLPKPEPGMPEPGIQAAFGGVPEKIVRPQPRFGITQAALPEARAAPAAEVPQPLLRKPPSNVSYQEVPEVIPKSQAIAEFEADLAAQQAELAGVISPVDRSLIGQTVKAIRENIQRVRQSPGETITVRRYRPVGEVAPPARAAPAAEAAQVEAQVGERYAAFLDKVGLKWAQEEAGQSILDDLALAGRSPAQVSDEFWANTYPKLPRAAQVRFERYFKKVTGEELGKNIQEAARAADLPEGPAGAELLEGIERGYVTLMEVGNKRFARAALPTPSRAAPAPKAVAPKVPAKPPVEPPTAPPPIAEPPITPPTPPEDPVAKLTRLIRAAKPARKETEALKHKELQERVAAYARVLGQTEGEEAFLRARGALKGELPRAQFEPPRVAMTSDDLLELFETIRTTPKIPEGRVLQRGNTADALTKLLSGQIPQRAELALLERVFGPELVKALLAKRGFWAKFGEAFVDVLNIPRTFKAMMDLSATLRQGAALAVGEAVSWGKSFPRMMKVVFSEKNYLALDDQIRAHPSFPLYEASGGYLGPVGESASLVAREEQFMSRLVRKIPVLGHVVRASERAYVGFLNALRTDVFYKYHRLWGDAVPEGTYRELAGFINAATGRGGLGALESTAPVLSGFFFSPRFVMSRIQAPAYLFSSSPLVRKVAMKNLGSYAALLAGTLFLAERSGFAKVELNPLSSDWGKMRIGRIRLDFMAGYQPYVRYMAQMIMGKKKAVVTGKIRDIDRMGLVGRFGRSKLAPGSGVMVDITTGETFVGEEVALNRPALLRMVYENLVPFAPDDIIEAVREEGWEAGALVTVPGILGVGIQTYATIGQMEEEVTAQLFPDKRYLELNNDQRRQVRDSPEIQEAIKKIKDEGTMDMREATNFAFRRFDDLKAEGETDLRAHLDAGMKGKALRKTISEFKKGRFNASSVLLTEEILEYALGDRQIPLEDVLAERYWAAEAPEDPTTGVLDFNVRDALRDAVVEAAIQQGVDPAYITGTGEGTYRGKRFVDDRVRAALEDYEADQETLKPYYDLYKDIFGRNEAALWRRYRDLQMGDPKEARKMWRANPPYSRRDAMRLRALNRMLDREKLLLRRNRPEIDAVLYKWDRVSRVLSREALQLSR